MENKFKITGFKLVLYKNDNIGFDSVLHFYFFIFQLFFRFENNKYSKKKYGIHFDKDIISLYFGLKEKHIYLPWQYKFYDAYVLKNDETWEKETKDN